MSANSFRMFRRGNVFWCQNNQTDKQESLGTKDRSEARRLLSAKNESKRQPYLNLQIARAYLVGSNPELTTRTWSKVMHQILVDKGWTAPEQQNVSDFDSTPKKPTKLSDSEKATLRRWQVAVKNKSFDLIRELPLIQTTPEHFQKVLSDGKVSTNVYLRRIHNYAVDYNFLVISVIPKSRWPAVRYGVKRAISFEEHQSILARETNLERKAFYEIAWHMGAAQSDLACLNAEDIDWKERTVSYVRKKTKKVAHMRIGSALETLLKALSKQGPLFPYLRTVRASDRATEFKQRCEGLGIKGVTLHSYRYAWAERAKLAGMPERFAQEALGQSSKAVQRAYAKGATPVVPSLENYEERVRNPNILQLQHSMA